MKQIERFLCIILIIAVSAVTPLYAADDALKKVLDDTAKVVYTTAAAPKVGSIGGEWAIFGLSRSGYTLPEKYYRDYYAAVEKQVKDTKGILSKTKNTEYSRLILALSAIGMDARSVAGYDLTKPLGDFDATMKQGINGAIFALLALDSADYPMPKNTDAAVQATRQLYVDKLLDSQLSSGGWSLLGADGGEKNDDTDITAMALQALAKYRSQSAVEKAVQKALTCLSKKQNSSGGFGTTDTAETCAQVIIALCELGIPLTDSRFVGQGNSVLDRLLDFTASKGGFVHTLGSTDANPMATEQSLMALAAVVRAGNKSNGIYVLSDPLKINMTGGRRLGEGLENKKPYVKAVPITQAGASFTDLASDAYDTCRTAIEKLAERSIITGKASELFYPDDGMTRAEFAAIIVRALGLTQAKTSAFTDVSTNAWYAGYIGTAYQNGIVTGIGGGLFNPNGGITKQEAAVMVTRAAKLCGMDTELPAISIRNVLAQFSDYTKTAEWARSSLAFLYAQGILDDAELTIDPNHPILRREVAVMVYRLLVASNLI